jgi:hypothetical protein
MGVRTRTIDWNLMDVCRSKSVVLSISIAVISLQSWSWSRKGHTRKLAIEAKYLAKARFQEPKIQVRKQPVQHLDDNLPGSCLIQEHQLPALGTRLIVSLCCFSKVAEEGLTPRPDLCNIKWIKASLGSFLRSHYLNTKCPTNGTTTLD